MDIRPASTADVDDIAAVHRLSRADYYGSSPDERDGREEMWEHLLGESGRLTFVAEASGHVGAFMSARRLTDPDGALELSALYVHPAHFARGIGSRLYQMFESARRHNEPALLEVWDGNRRAVEFYERRGWTRTDEARPGPQEFPYVTYRLMARNLAD